MASSMAITEYAKKYGIANEPWLEDGHSGLTPVEPMPPGMLQNDLAGFHYNSIVTCYQRSELWGFETKYFVNSGALTDPECKVSNLTEIHPIFARDRWETELPSHCAFYPLGNGREGEFWRADNDDVWRVLTPCLALASQFLENFHLRPWWDALIHGQRQVLPDDQRPPTFKGRLERFFARAAWVSGSINARNNCRRRFDECLGKVTWGISSGFCEPETGLHEGTWIGQTISRWFSSEDDGIRVHLAFEDLAPLLFGDISMEEKLITQFYVAETMVHELAHAFLVVLDPTIHDHAEPYYENEGVCEVGYSMMNACFGGRTFRTAFTHRRDRWDMRWISMYGLIYEVGFPTPSDVSSSFPVLDGNIKYGTGTWDRYLVPLKYISNIQRKSFWETFVPIYGSSAMAPYPLIYGLRETRTQEPGFPSRLNYLFPTDYDAFALPSEANTDRANAARQMRNRRIRRAKQLHELMAASLAQEAAQPAIRINNIPRFTTSKEGRHRFRLEDTQSPEEMDQGTVLQLLLTHRVALCLDSMCAWTPSNLLLDYLHRTIPADADRVSPEAWESFLVACETHRRYFRFRRYGNGEVRTIDDGWPALPVEPEVADADKLQPVDRQLRFNNTVHMYGKHIYNDSWKKGQPVMADLDRDIYYQEMSRLFASKHQTGLQRGTFDRAMAVLSQKKLGVLEGPCNTYRTMMDVPESDDSDDEPYDPKDDKIRDSDEEDEEEEVEVEEKITEESKKAGQEDAGDETEDDDMDDYSEEYWDEEDESEYGYDDVDEPEVDAEGDIKMRGMSDDENDDDDEHGDDPHPIVVPGTDPIATDPVIDPALTGPVVDPIVVDPVIDPALTDPVVDPTRPVPAPAPAPEIPRESAVLGKRGRDIEPDSDDDDWNTRGDKWWSSPPSKRPKL